MTKSNPSFDLAAKTYDIRFSNTCVGQAQRKQVWNTIASLKLSKTKTVLELNCGTGEDASIWNESGFQILATDISEDMIFIAKEKFPDLHFEQLDIRNAYEKLQSNQIVFSNFGGFNCLNSAEINLFFRNSSPYLTKSDSIILVIMGKKCFWDNLFLLLKFRFKEIGRRNTNSPINVNVDGSNVETYYYSPKMIENFAGTDFETICIKPIGLFVPPSYLSPFFEQKKRSMWFLEKLDGIFSKRILANRADHFIICLQKK